MANSINTNYGAMVALQSLNQTGRDLATTQNRINTGLKVASAKDNGAIWSIAQSQKADMVAMDSVKNSLNRGQSVVDVGLAAGETIMAALQEMKALAVSIEAGTADGSDVTGYQADFTALVGEVNDAISAASFDGTSAFTASADAVITGLGDGTGLTTADLGAGLAASALTNASDSDAVQTEIERVATALQTLGTQSKSFARQATFVGKLQDALETGVGNLVDADLAKESARLTALQTKQQLGVQALSIANQSSSILLGLFR